MKADIPEALMFGALAAGMKEALVESGLLAEFADVLKTIERVRLFKEGYLTADQAAAMLQISRRMFDREVQGKKFSKYTQLGTKEPRYSFVEIVTKMERSRVAPEGEQKTENLAGLTAGSPREKKAA